MTFELWRMDDNGNRFLVDVFAEQSVAENRMAELCRSQHKQTYWILACADTELSGVPDRRG
ncbi:MAG TPA: hypothetical protein VFF53_13215 [Geobacteraceae bacterium]|nr:hypothetical protein [Geobacteraceae bacterium]